MMEIVVRLLVPILKKEVRNKVETEMREISLVDRRGV
jgi:hypothetical protein